MTADADGSVFVGSHAGYSITSGIGNIAIGYQAFDAATEVDYNTIIGHQAGTDMSGSAGTQAVANTIVGYRAGYDQTTARFNTYMGKEAGYTNTTGESQTYLGAFAGYATTGSSYNTAVGSYALYSGGGKTSGITAIGFQSLFSYKTIGTGWGLDGGVMSAMTSVGFESALYAGVGNNNTKGCTYLGFRAGKHTTGSYNTFVGSNAGLG